MLVTKLYCPVYDQDDERRNSYASPARALLDHYNHQRVNTSKITDALLGVLAFEDSTVVCVNPIATASTPVTISARDISLIEKRRRLITEETKIRLEDLE